jgi:serine/threonine protein kinase
MESIHTQTQSSPTKRYYITNIIRFNYIVLTGRFSITIYYTLTTIYYHLFGYSELTKLSEESLTRQPEEVFDIICKLGEGSYGSVYKALHKESGQVLAIKQVPVDTDLQEIIKEISIMQQCDSPYVVKYYGSYFKNTDLWVSFTLPKP